MEFYYIAQAGLENNPPASISQVPKIPGVFHYALIQ